jgi:hypothetical protein
LPAFESAHTRIITLEWSARERRSIRAPLLELDDSRFEPAAKQPSMRFYDRGKARVTFRITAYRVLSVQRSAETPHGKLHDASLHAVELDFISVHLPLSQATGFFMTGLLAVTAKKV